MIERTQAVHAVIEEVGVPTTDGLDYVAPSFVAKLPSVFRERQSLDRSVVVLSVGNLF
jgi:hypothetical protein